MATFDSYRAAPQVPLIRFTRRPGGEWTIVTADRRRRSDFAEIEDAVLFARQSCEAAPATLWLDVDGLVVIVPQDRGWTRPLIGDRTPRP
jgi:hypothetical protein